MLPVIATHGGEVVNSTGDGYCAVFADAEEAVICAVEIQERLIARAISTPLGALQIRVGLHTGFAQPSGGDIIATTMDKAARVQSKADGAQTLVSRETHALARDKLKGFGFVSAGMFDLKDLESEELFIAFRDGQNPAAKAEEAYRQHIIERFGKLTLYSVTSDKPLAVDLEKVFVKLTATEKRISRPFDERDLLRHEREEKGELIPLRAKPLEDTTVTLSLNEALREHRDLAILGAPGSGKTTVLKYLALSFARRDARARLDSDEDRLPLYLALRDFNRWLDAQEKQKGLPPYLPPSLLPQFLNHFYTEQYSSLRLPPGFFELALEQGRCAVLLDGLDEVADTGKRIRAAEFAARCLDCYAGNRFVLTSRPRGYETACRQQLASRCGECSIRDFDEDQIRSFAQTWYLAVTVDRVGDTATARDEAAKRADDLLEAVETPRVRPLATNPLLLSILALIHQRGNRLPQRRVALYEECIEFLLGYGHQVKGGEAARELADIGGLSRTEKRALLEPVALWLHERGEKGTDATKDELEEQLGRHFHELYGIEPPQARRRAREFVDIIVQHAGLLVEREEGVFAFAHLTFQEFLAARALADKKEYWETLKPHLHDPWWREVVLLLGGHLSSPATRRAREDTAELLRNVLNAGSWLESDLHRDLLLAFRCSCDMEQLGIDDSLRRELAEKAFALWEESKIDALRDDILELFRYAGPTPAGEWTRGKLLALSHDRAATVRFNAAFALGRLGAAAATPEVVARLVALSQDADNDVRYRAAFTLGELGAAAATPEVVARLVALSQDADNDVRSCAASALGELGAAAATPEVLARLLALSQDADNDVRSFAASALGELGAAAATPEVLARLLALSQDVENYVRFCAASALGGLGAAAATPEVVARLLALTQNADNDVRSARRLRWANSARRRPRRKSWPGCSSSLRTRIAASVPARRLRWADSARRRPRQKSWPGWSPSVRTRTTTSVPARRLRWANSARRRPRRKSWPGCSPSFRTRTTTSVPARRRRWADSARRRPCRKSWPGCSPSFRMRTATSVTARRLRWADSARRRPRRKSWPGCSPSVGTRTTTSVPARRLRWADSARRRPRRKSWPGCSSSVRTRIAASVPARRLRWADSARRRPRRKSWPGCSSSIRTRIAASVPRGVCAGRTRRGGGHARHFSANAPFGEDRASGCTGRACVRVRAVGR